MVDGTVARAYAADSPGRMAAQKRAELGDVLMANEETIRGMKRRLGIAEEALRIKKERLEDAVQEYDEEHRTSGYGDAACVGDVDEVRVNQ